MSHDRFSYMSPTRFANDATDLCLRNAVFPRKIDLPEPACCISSTYLQDSAGSQFGVVLSFSLSESITRMGVPRVVRECARVKMARGDAHTRTVVAPMQSPFPTSQRAFKGHFQRDTVGSSWVVALPLRVPNLDLTIPIREAPASPNPTRASGGAMGWNGTVLIDLRPEAVGQGLRMYGMLVGHRGDLRDVAPLGVSSTAGAFASPNFTRLGGAV